MEKNENKIVYTYSAEDNHEQYLYVNLTNHCTNRCTFCIRNNKDGIGEGRQLWLEHEPSAEEVIAALSEYDVKAYEEVVFCGYGEPTMRIETLIEVAKYLKEHYGARTRINTNGHGNEFHKKDITPLFEGVIDTVSVSMNASNSAAYDTSCRSIYGERAFEIMLDFAKKAKEHTDVVFSVVDIIGADEVAACQRLADEIGVRLRVREYIEE